METTDTKEVWFDGVYCLPVINEGGFCLTCYVLLTWDTQVVTTEHGNFCGDKCSNIFEHPDN